MTDSRNEVDAEVLLNPLSGATSPKARNQETLSNTMNRNHVRRTSDNSLQHSLEVSDHKLKVSL